MLPLSFNNEEVTQFFGCMTNRPPRLYTLSINIVVCIRGKEMCECHTDLDTVQVYTTEISEAEYA